MEFLYALDKALFLFINQTLSNPVGDVVWPLITDYDKLWPVRIILIAVWLWLAIKGGRRGRTVALMIIPVLVLSDKLSSAVIKEFVGRPRPCHEVSGVPIVQGIHLLVNCGTGKSFPSSHAVNNFALAVVFSFYYRKWIWWFAGWASLVALSRPAVGVHYPSDIVGGAIIGTLVAALVIWTWTNVEKRILPIRHEEVEKKESA
jgi:undecaprenyl-diphosphatase